MKTALLLLALPLLAACSSTPGPNDPTSTTVTSPPKPTASTASTTPPPADSVNAAEVEDAIKAGDGKKARKLADDLLAKNPKNPKAHYYAGVGADLDNDAAGAEKHYRDALALQADFNDAAVNLSSLLLSTKRAADAVALLKPFAAKFPDDALVQTNYATALAESGDSAQATEAYGKLAQKGKLTPEGRLGYAGVLIASNKKDDAAKVLRDGSASLGSDRDMLAAFGRAFAKAGAYDDAIKSLDKALQIKPGADLFTYRALFKRSVKKLDDARADLDAAIKDNPKFVPAYLYLGEVLEEQKKPADAKKAYEKAIELEPDSPQAKKAKEHLEAMKKK